MNTWQFSKIWNKALENQEIRKITPRNRIWASELGKSHIDLYLKMKGVEPTNPPNPRSLRKFEAGNMFEWIVSLILKRAGILKEAQKWSSFQYPDLLEVTGKADFLAGGVPKSSEEALSELKGLGLPDFFLRGTGAIITHLASIGELKEIPLEIKSVSAFMFDSLERTNRSSKNHRLQLFHYLKAMNYEYGHIVYICRDDLRMMEIKVDNNEENEKEYKNYIETLSNYCAKDEQPPLEQAVIFDKDIGKFAKNWNIAYSLYLTKLYEFKSQFEFDEKYQPIVARWNRVIARVKDGKEMTVKNKEVLEEIKTAGFSVEEVLNNFNGGAGENEDEV